MSILIKGMKMPERCVDCRFCDEIDGTCIALNDNSTACITGKPKWCPLVEVPDDVVPVKHGKWYTKSMTRRGGHGEAYFVYGCSLCKKKIRYKTDFCPNCGATMDGRT